MMLKHPDYENRKALLERRWFWWQGRGDCRGWWVDEDVGEGKGFGNERGRYLVVGHAWRRRRICCPLCPPSTTSPKEEEEEEEEGVSKSQRRAAAHHHKGHRNSTRARRYQAKSVKV